MIRLVIFDLDGTLLDTIGDLSASCDELLRARGLPRHTWEEYRLMVGNGIRKLVERALPESMRDEATVENARVQFVDYYVDHIDLYTHPYEGIETLVRTLCERGVMLAVVSNKFQQGTSKLIARFFPDAEFVAVFGQREGFPLKPDPGSDLEILRMTGVAPLECLHIGDSAMDVEAARAAGVRSVGVTWGFRPREELVESGADFIVDRPEELIDIIDSI